MENKELFLEKLKNINPNIYDVKISKGVDYSHIPTSIDDPLKILTYISIISGDFTVTISSNNGASFSVFNKDNIFECRSFALEYDGLFKEAYNILKPLLVIDV